MIIIIIDWKANGVVKGVSIGSDLILQGISFIPV